MSSYLTLQTPWLKLGNKSVLSRCECTYLTSSGLAYVCLNVGLLSNLAGAATVAGTWSVPGASRVSLEHI